MNFLILIAHHDKHSYNSLVCLRRNRSLKKNCRIVYILKKKFILKYYLFKIVRYVILSLVNKKK